ncbi:ESPR-type extended signal peptide-containing protein [Veillonella tobetsuensis]|uniref:ESPR-type extended signal peptide-containing protein n=1 Tax=Veillonella tobetsuensis TaxID=1110546 RepID=UPI000750D81B|nr:ESPR-type extended signal peptide-containing protein [Veillonella tobetsuensis]
MNKVFKVVYSKSKGCYVVVPETAKNNNGKKKVLASVLAGLAVAGVVGGIAPQQAMAGVDTGNSHVNIWADTNPKGNGQNYNVGQNSIVVGYQNTTDNVAGHDGKVAIGAKNTSTNNASTAVGNENKATGGAATAVGAGNTASGKASVALGNVNNADAKAAIAIGTYNNVNYTKGSWQTTPKQAGEYSTVVGNYSSATGTSASAMGVYTNATGAGSFAAGYNNNAKGQNSVAIGSENTSHVADTVTLGQFNNAKTMGGISIGKNNLTDSSNDGRNAANTKDENSQIAIGRDNVATHLDTIAIGRETTASGSGSTVVGARAEASGDNSIAIGQSGKGSPKVIASGVNSIAIGMQSQATGEAAIAEGAGSRAGGKYGVALGRKTKANAEAATALGNAAEANIANGVALGSSSVTTTDKGVKGYNPSDDHTRHYTNLANNVRTATTAAVSIGNGSTLTRQLTGLAAGTADTDAVNVAQLKNVGVAVTGNTGSSDFLADGGKLNVIGEGRVSTVAAHDGAKDSKITVGFDDKGMVKAGKNVKVDEVTVNGRTTYTIHAADAAAKYDFLTNAKANGGKLDGTATPTKVESGTTVSYAAGKNLTVKQDINQSAGEQTYTYSLNKDLKEITSITNNGGPTLNFGDNNISVTGGNLDLGDQNITHLHSGGDTVDNAANIGDVIRISKANDLHIAPTAGTNNNVTEYTVDANKKVTLTYQDGNGKTVNGPKAVIDLSGLKTGDMSSFNVKSSATEGKVAQGSAGIQEIRDGKTVEMQAGKNMTIKQTNKNGNAAVEFALNKDIDLTPDGSIKIGDTNITDNGLTINGGPSITKTGINAGDLKITNVKAGINDNDAVNVSQLKQVRADERHIKPGEYAVDNNGKVTMTYLDGNNKDVANETAVITGIAKQDLSNINKGGETVIQNLAKKSIDMENGKNTKVSNREINGVKTFKVDVEGDLNDITSITNKAGDGKVVFGGNQTVNVTGDHNINLNAKVGDITGLTNVTLDAPDFAKKGRAATEEQLKIVNNGFNNTVGLTGNTGATELQKLNKQGGLSFGVVGANNGQYITTTAAGSNVVADLSADAKNKLNSTVVVEGKNAARVTSNVIQNADGSTKTVYTVDVNNVKPTAASTEKVQAKADVAGSSDKNIAKVAPKAGENFGDAGATYEVNVSRNDVKDAAREAITVNTSNTTNNSITVTPVQDETNHNTTYTVTFDGNKAATQIPLTYKANGQNAQTVTLDKGLNFTNGRNTTASVDAEGVVKYDLNNNIDLTPNGSLKIGDTIVNNGGLTISGGPSITKTGINAGNLNITNVKAGVNNTDAVNVQQLKDARTLVTSNDNSVTINKTESGNQITYDLHVAPGAAQSVWNVKSTGNTTADSETAAKTITDGKTVEMVAGKNLTVKQTSNNDGAKVEYALSGNLTNINTIKNEGPATFTIGGNEFKFEGGNVNMGDNNITNLKSGGDVINNAANIGDVNRISKANDKHIKPGEYGVDNNGKVTMTYVDGNNKEISNETAVITGIAKSDLSNITKGGETVIQNIAKKSIDMEDGKNTKASNRDVNGVKTFKVDVEGDLTDVTSITNKTGDGKVSFVGNQTVNVAGDHNIALNAKAGDITGLTNVTLNSADFATKGRAATEEQLKIVNNGFNNTVGLTGNTGATDLQKLNQAGGLSFGVIGANNGQYIKTTAAGSNVAVDLSDDAKAKLNNTVEVRGKNAAKVTSVTENTADGGKKTIYTVDVDNVKPTAASTEKVQAKADVAGSSDKNIAKVTPQAGDQFGDAGATYEVNVSRNDVKDAAREAVTVNTTNTTNNPITVTPVQDETNHNTTYQVTFDGNKAATQIPLTYKANGQNAQTVTLDKGLNFTNGSNTTASVAADGVVKYDLNNNIDLTPNGSLKIGDTIVNNGGLTISGGPSITKTGINAGNLNITNVKAGVNNTDAVNVQQLKDARTLVTSNDNSVTINKTESGNQITYDLHVAPGAAQSVWNVKSSGNTTADSEATAKTITDGKTVEMVAGKNLTVKQTSNNDGAKVEYALSDDIKVGNDGKDGKPGKDGSIGVNGKDGSSVVINGKDGSIGLNGKDGKDGLTMKAENGQPGVNGKDGITRIVYEDKTNTKHEVATLDDGLKFTGNNTDTVNNHKLNSLVKVQGEGVDKTTSATFKSATGNINVKADGTDTLEVQLNKDLKNITTIKNDGPATLTIGGNEFKFSGGNVNMGDNNITNLKSGGDVINNAANIGDVKRISKANDLHIAPTTSDRAGETTATYAYNTADKSVTLKYNDGNGTTQTGTIAKIDLSGLADQIKDGYSFSTDAKGNVVGNHAVTAVGNGKTVSYAAGDNLTIAQHIDNATGEQTYTYALSNDIKVGNDGKDGKPGVDGKIGVNGKDGSSVVINGKDGSIGLNGKDGKDGLTMKAKDGQPGVNGKDGITRIVYEDNSKHTHEVATLDDGMKYAGDDAQGADKSKVIAKKLNETMDVVGGADKSKLTDNNIGVNNVDGKLKVQLSKEVNLTPSGSLTIGDTVVNNNGLTISGGPSITKTGINAGNKTIVNVDAGVNDTDAVNVQQLKKAKTEVKAGNNVTVDTTYGNDGHTIYTVNANDVALGDAVLKYSANGTNTQSVKLSQGLNFVDGNYTSASVDVNGQVKYDVTIGKVKDGVDGKPGVDGKDGIATVKTVVDTINNSGWKGDVTGNTVNNHTATIVKPGTTVNFGAGKNLTVEQIVNAVTGDHTYNYALSDDIKVGHDGKDGKPGVDGKIGVNGKDGSSVVINGKDGSIGLNGKDGKDGLTMKAKDGQPGVNGKDGITRIVYEDNNKNTHEVATLDDGMKYAGDDAQGTDKSKVIAKKLNQTMDIVGGANSTKLTDNNIGVNNVDGKLKVQLAQNIDLTPAGSLTIGGTSITDNGLVINQGPSITKGGINAGNQFITNVKAGVNNTDAVNVAQLKSAKTEVEEGDNVKVTSRTGADGQTIYKVSAKAVNLGDAELKYSANGTNTQSVKLSQGLNFVDGNYTTASVDANGQVKYDVTIGKVKDGVDGKPGVDGKDGIATVKTVVDTINNSGWKANATGNVVGNSTATIVKPGNTVNYGAGKNLNVKQTVNGDEQTYEFALDKDLKELNSVQTKNIYLGSPTSHTTITYNNDNSRIEYTTKEGDKKQVANLDDIWTIQANGTDVKPVGGKVNVVGGDHIKVSTDAAGKMTISADGLGTMNGFNVKSTGNTTSDSDKTAKNITDGKTVEFSGGKNLTVKQTNTADGAKVEFALNNNIDLTPNGSVTIGDTVVNNDGLTITGGPTITKNNVDMGGQQIHNVKSGGDVDSNGANIGDIKRISKANDTRIKDGNYEVSQNGTVEMTYVDGAGKQVVDANGNPVKATISGIARQDLSNITNEGKKVITGLSSIVKGGNNVTVDTSVDNTTGQKTYTVNADLSGAKVNASVGADGSGVAKGLKNPVKVEKGTQYIAGDNMVVERKPVEGDDKIDNSITYSLAHDLTEITSISNGGATLRINSNPGSVPGDRAPVTPAFEVHGGNLSLENNRIVNLAPGIAGTDGVNVDQLKGSRTTLTSEDNSVTLNRTDNGQGGYNYDLSVKGVNDPRVNILNEEIGLVGAQGAALSALKPMQYDPMEPTQIMAGYGNYRGNSALALGVAHYKNESTMFHGGISWAGGSSHMMANAGVTWKIGNRDSEGAVADRYRKGPISSTYAMQTEVASMKAQNAGLKGEVSDLKAENEQIKAQNAGLQNEVDQLKAQMAAMMARLGM